MLRERWSSEDLSNQGDERAQTWLADVDPTAYVGARHHTVPRFLLTRWANKNGQVRVHHRIEGRSRIENIRDLAIKDFYTFVDVNEAKNSSFESLLGAIESSAKPHIDGILSPFRPTLSLNEEAIASLDQFAAFQSTRTARHRREVELHAEWYAKTMAAGRVADEELQHIRIVPHQNESIQLLNEAALQLMPFFICRPMAVVYLPEPLLHICDEPVILNAPVGEFHVEDCFLSDEEIEAKKQRRLKNLPKRKRATAKLPGRVVHFSSTRPTGHGVADEIVLPISPRAALLWGPLACDPQMQSAEPVHLPPDEAVRFATLANEAMNLQALDWIASRISDSNFENATFSPTGPLMRVCDGVNAASLAVNTTPQRFRPHRLWVPD